MLQRLLLPVIFLFLVTVSAQAATLNGRVSWIYDGDTIKVEGIGKVRLLGIDTPEYKESPRDRFYSKNFQIKPKRLRLISRQAKKYNVDHVKGHWVRLELDQSQKDKYDRVLAYVFLPNGDMLNQVLLEKGLATVFRRYDFRYKKTFISAEKKARQQKLGLWER
ncbi:MAG: thermonuclease family protein [Desulfuromonadales bacterium]|nr:thermonuclease family protein [Desulfuromonadales bacterium]